MWTKRWVNGSMEIKIDGQLSPTPSQEDSGRRINRAQELKANLGIVERLGLKNKQTKIQISKQILQLFLNTSKKEGDSQIHPCLSIQNNQRAFLNQ